MNVVRPRVIRFGVLAVNLRSGELFKDAHKIKIEDQPFQVLSIGLENLGEVGALEELQQCIWLERTFVDFDHGLNVAIQKLRLALGVSAESPRYVETLPSRGYRFIYPVQRLRPRAWLYRELEKPGEGGPK